MTSEERHRPDVEQIHRDAVVVNALNPAVFDDFGEMRAGGLTAINVSLTSGGDFVHGVRKLGRWQTKIDQREDLVLLGRRVADVHRAKASGRLAVFLGMQNTAAAEDDVSLLEPLRDLGIRLLQLTYNGSNRAGSGCLAAEDRGLTPFGRDLIRAMNDLGIVLDLSHVGPRTAMDAIEASGLPVIFSHSNARALCDHPRNLRDEHIRAVAGAGGVIGVCAVAGLIKRSPGARLDDFLAHIDYLADRAGIDHVGLGLDLVPGATKADFLKELAEAGTPTHDLDPDLYPEWNWHWMPELDRLSKVGNITRGLVARGYRPEEIEKILGGNFLRVFAATFG